VFASARDVKLLLLLKWQSSAPAIFSKKNSMWHDVISARTCLRGALGWLHMQPNMSALGPLGLGGGGWMESALGECSCPRSSTRKKRERNKSICWRFS
jgi:hypothetical protein